MISSSNCWDEDKIHYHRPVWILTHIEFFHFLISLFIEMIVKLLPSITTISLLGSITLQHLSCVGSECNRHYVCAVNHCNYHNTHPRLHYKKCLKPPVLSAINCHALPSPQLIMYSDCYEDFIALSSNSNVSAVGPFVFKDNNVAVVF